MLFLEVEIPISLYKRIFESITPRTSPPAVDKISALNLKFIFFHEILRLHICSPGGTEEIT